MTNLVSNAIKYSDAGSVVRVRLTSTPRHQFLEVVDHGIGMAADDVDQMFTPFHRSGDPAARSRPGTGLGMAIVDRVVRRHRGHIAVRSRLGEGTTVRVALAAAAPE